MAVLVHASWLEMGPGASKERYQKDDQEKESVYYTREITSRIKRPIWSDEENKALEKFVMAGLHASFKTASMLQGCKEERIEAINCMPRLL